MSVRDDEYGLTWTRGLVIQVIQIAVDFVGSLEFSRDRKLSDPRALAGGQAVGDPAVRFPTHRDLEAPVYVEFHGGALSVIAREDQ